MAKKTTATKKRAAGTRATGKPKSQLRRTYKGREIVVDVLADGFKYEGETYTSLSALAKHIVGYGISGPHFFRIAGEPEASK